MEKNYFVLDNGGNHEEKIELMGLTCEENSGRNHMAAFLVWAYRHDFLSYSIYSGVPELKKTLRADEDIRPFFTSNAYLQDTIRTEYFDSSIIDFVRKYYRFGFSQDVYGRYPSAVDEYAKAYWGEEKYNSDEFQNEAYMFVPYNKEYCDGMCQIIDEAYEKYLEEKSKRVDIAVLDEIINSVKEATAQKAVRITLDFDRVPELTDSKFGGYPYWPSGKEYPVNDRGENLILLAQINLKDVNNELFPEKGLLQFYIDCDDCLGIRFDEENQFKVVYHENIDSSVSEHAVRGMGIIAASEVDMSGSGWMPLETCVAVKMEEIIDYEPVFTYYDDADIAAIIKEKTGLEYDPDFLYRSMNRDDYDYLFDAIESSGHKMLGYPFFTQGEVREPGDRHDTLLFQMDTDDGPDGQYVILWGDSGVGNFFINREDLMNRKFDDIIYTWDCC